MRRAVFFFLVSRLLCWYGCGLGGRAERGMAYSCLVLVCARRVVCGWVLGRGGVGAR
jgi:hypothetical protein